MLPNVWPFIFLNVCHSLSHRSSQYYLWSAMAWQVSALLLFGNAGNFLKPHLELSTDIAIVITPTVVISITSPTMFLYLLNTRTTSSASLVNHCAAPLNLKKTHAALVASHPLQCPCLDVGAPVLPVLALVRWRSRPQNQSHPSHRILPSKAQLRASGTMRLAQNQHFLRMIQKHIPIGYIRLKWFD